MTKLVDLRLVRHGEKLRGQLETTIGAVSRDTGRIGRLAHGYSKLLELLEAVSDQLAKEILLELDKQKDPGYSPATAIEEGRTTCS